jgi:glycine C-acetyltransferase
MNSNSYLSLANHPEVIRATDEATHALGVGPGAVRFIDGTFSHHVALETRIARFVGKPAAKIFNSAYTANCGLALAVSTPATFWVGDQLNHNSIIRAMRIANVPSANKAVYRHNDMDHLGECLRRAAGSERDGHLRRHLQHARGLASIDRIAAVVAPSREDSRRAGDDRGRLARIGAYGPAGRGTVGHGALPDSSSAPSARPSAQTAASSPPAPAWSKPCARRPTPISTPTL